MKNFLILLFFFNTSFMYAMSGNQLSEFCEEKSQVGKGVCSGYINGFLDAFFVIQNFLDDGEQIPLLITPNGVSNKQRVEVVKKYLKDNPNMLHNAGGYLIYDATFNAFDKSNFIMIKKAK